MANSRGDPRLRRDPARGDPMDDPLLNEKMKPIHYVSVVGVAFALSAHGVLKKMMGQTNARVVEFTIIAFCVFLVMWSMAPPQPPSPAAPRKVGVVGYGKLGKFLVEHINKDPSLQLAWVWNRSPEALEEIPPDERLLDLEDIGSKEADLIVEVAHPSIVAKYGAKFVAHADLMVGSPTCFADQQVEKRLRDAVARSRHGLYVPAGALWGSKDIQKMGMLGSLSKLSVSMAFHPHSLKLTDPGMVKKLAQAQDKAVTLYEGSVRGLAPLAPNNVNTMACAALAAKNLGFDGTDAKLIADGTLEAHVIEVVAEGANGFKVSTTRYNPARKNAVTGSATFNSFRSSLMLAHNQGPGIHFC